MSFGPCQGRPVDHEHHHSPVERATVDFSVVIQSCFGIGTNKPVDLSGPFCQGNMLKGLHILRPSRPKNIPILSFSKSHSVLLLFRFCQRMPGSWFRLCHLSQEVGWTLGKVGTTHCRNGLYKWFDWLRLFNWFNIY